MTMITPSLHACRELRHKKQKKFDDVVSHDLHLVEIDHLSFTAEKFRTPKHAHQLSLLQRLTKIF